MQGIMQALASPRIRAGVGHRSEDIMSHIDLNLCDPCPIGSTAACADPSPRVAFPGQGQFKSLPSVHRAVARLGCWIPAGAVTPYSGSLGATVPASRLEAH